MAKPPKARVDIADRERANGPKGRVARAGAVSSAKVAVGAIRLLVRVVCEPVVREARVAPKVLEWARVVREDPKVLEWGDEDIEVRKVVRWVREVREVLRWVLAAVWVEGHGAWVRVASSARLRVGAGNRLDRVVCEPVVREDPKVLEWGDEDREVRKVVPWVREARVVPEVPRWALAAVWDRAAGWVEGRGAWGRVASSARLKARAISLLVREDRKLVVRKGRAARRVGQWGREDREAWDRVARSARLKVKATNQLVRAAREPLARVVRAAA
ncbi:MAG: hypothetical protein ACYC0Y_18405 [Pirellulales bacterium]